jgi:hypothetical protein
MKNRSAATLLTLLCVFALHPKAFSQLHINSSAGYTVNITAVPTQLIPDRNPCPYGYNYNLRIHYAVTITGNVAAANLYTLQGTIGCGSQSLFFDLPNGAGTGNTVTTSNPWRANTDCNSASPNSLNCNIARIQVEGVGIAPQTVSYTINYTSLPVLFASFNATATNGHVNLKWSTATEIDNDHFSIERSANGSNWTTIATLPGAGNSVSLLNYQYTDNQPLSGTSFYRIKQTDLDGHYSYTETRQIQDAAINGTISIAPVPNTGRTISIAGISNYNGYELTVYNTAGAGVYITKPNSSSVTLPALAKGVYMIRIANSNSGDVQTMRYVQL